MKLYRVSAPPHGTGDDTTARPGHVGWFGSEAECGTERKRLVSSGIKRADIETETIDIPTDKKGLLAWLNENGV